MKKTIKSSLLLVFMAVMIFALTGCGTSKLVATKSTSADESLTGQSSEEKIEVTFKKDKVDKIVWTMEFEDESSASTMVGLYKLASSEIGDLDINQDGKKVVLTMDGNTFSKLSDLDDDDLTKESITKTLKDEGYTIK